MEPRKMVFTFSAIIKEHSGHGELRIEFSKTSGEMLSFAALAYHEDVERVIDAVLDTLNELNLTIMEFNNVPVSHVSEN